MRSFLQNIAAVSRFPRRDLLRILIPVALLALIASVVTGMERPAGPAPATRLDSRPRAHEADLDLSGLREETPAAADAPREPVRDPFAQRSFSGAPQNAAAAPAAAAVPALPYRYIGKAIEDGKLSVFLQRGEQSYSVRAGDRIDGEYRVAKVTESTVTFVYLPKKQKQTLEIPAVN
jgi:hypothetical protein